MVLVAAETRKRCSDRVEKLSEQAIEGGEAPLCTADDCLVSTADWDPAHTADEAAVVAAAG